jgi:outer membrane lipoprotein carrier protein
MTVRCAPLHPCCWVAILVLALSAVAASEGELVDRLQARYDTLSDLRADFVQELHSGLLGADEPEKGRLVVTKSGMMRWDYQHPEPKVALVRGTRAWLYLPEENEVQCYALDDLSRDDVVGALLTGSVDLRQAFRVEVLPREEPGQAVLRLRPHALSEEFEEILLTIAVDDLTVMRLQVIDPVGNRWEYHFRNVRINRGVRETVFRLHLPEDVVWTGPCFQDQPPGP